MNRRTLLRSAAAGSIVAVAGCLGTQAGTEASKNEGAAASIVNQELIHEGEGEDTEVRVEITVENVTDQRLGQVVSTATFVEDETLLGSWVTTVNGMAPGQHWLVSIRSGGTTGKDAAAVDDAQVEAEEWVSPSELGTDRIKIVEDALAHPGDDINVEGVAKNVGDERLEYATITATFLDNDDILLGQAVADTTRDVDPGQEFEFTLRYSSPVREENAVAGYQLTTDGGTEE